MDSEATRKLKGLLVIHFKENVYIKALTKTLTKRKLRKNFRHSSTLGFYREYKQILEFLQRESEFQKIYEIHLIWLESEGQEGVVCSPAQVLRP